MSISEMKAKIEIANQLTEMSKQVWDYIRENWDELDEAKRNELLDRRDILIANAKAVLIDALEEGTKGAEELIGKLDKATKRVKKYIKNIERVELVIDIAVKVSKVAATVVSGGTFNASQLFDTLINLSQLPRD